MRYSERKIDQRARLFGRQLRDKQQSRESAEMVTKLKELGVIVRVAIKKSSYDRQGIATEIGVDREDIFLLCSGLLTDVAVVRALYQSISEIIPLPEQNLI